MNTLAEYTHLYATYDQGQVALLVSVSIYDSFVPFKSDVVLF